MSFENLAGRREDSGNTVKHDQTFKRRRKSSKQKIKLFEWISDSEEFVFRNGWKFPAKVASSAWDNGKQNRSETRSNI